METPEVLQQYGLSEKEANVYLGCLLLGPASITRIAKKTGLKRPTTYLIIDELLKKHLLVAVPQAKKLYYKAEDPEKLITELERKKKKLAEILPSLKTLYQKSSKEPKIRMYEGKEKLYRLYEEIFRNKEIWAIFSIDRFLEVFTLEDNKHFFHILIRKGGFIYDLLEDTKKARQFAQAKYRMGVSQVKFLPKKMKIATDILIFNGKVALISFENVLGVVIEDESIATTQELLLQFPWEKV